MLATKVYGASDDLIEFEGELYDEGGCFGTDDDDHGVSVFFSDGTVLELKYGKMGRGIWGITLINQGVLFDHITYCVNDEENPSSDVAFFKEGLKWAYYTRDWKLVKGKYEITVL